MARCIASRSSNPDFHALGVGLGWWTTHFTLRLTIWCNQKFKKLKNDHCCTIGGGERKHFMHRFSLIFRLCISPSAGILTRLSAAHIPSIIVVSKKSAVMLPPTVLVEISGSDMCELGCHLLFFFSPVALRLCCCSRL